MVVISTCPTFTWAPLLIIGCLGLTSSSSMIGFEPGRSYEYLYKTEIKLDDSARFHKYNGDRASTFNVYTKFKVASIWHASPYEHIIKLSASDRGVGNLPAQDRHFSTILSSPTYFHWNDGKVQYIHTHVTSPIQLNLLKGIIDTFQLHSGLKTQKLITFVDIRGQCNVSYAKEDNNDIVVEKTCIDRNYVQQYSSYHMLDIEVTSHSKGHYEFNEDQLISKLIIDEIQTITPITRVFHPSTVTARQEMTFEGFSDDEIVLKGTYDEMVQDFEAKMMEKTTLRNFVEVDLEDEECEDLAKFVKEKKKRFTKVGNVGSSDLFLQLVKCFRQSNNESLVLAINKMKKNFPYYTFLLDVLCATQTLPSFEALTTLVDFEDESNILVEKLLTSLSYASYAYEELIGFLLGLSKHSSKNAAWYESVLNSLGSVIRSFDRQTHQNNDKLVHNVEKVLLKTLDDCKNQSTSSSSSSSSTTMSTPLCQEVLLRCLGNMGLTTSIPKIMEIVESSNLTAVCLTGLKALRHMNKGDVGKLKEKLLKIFFERTKSYDSTVRSEALHHLLQTKLTSQELEDIYVQSLDPYNTEFGLFIQSKLSDAAKNNRRLRKLLNDVLKEKHMTLNNYDTRSRKGSSLSFSSSFTSSPPITYKMFVENGKSHVVKRSGMSVGMYLQQKQQQLQQPQRLDQQQEQPQKKKQIQNYMEFYKFELFASGMEGLLGNEEMSSEDADAEVPTAGLQLDIMGVSSRPITFFQGQGQLMSALWNAPSELTSALQSSILLHDHIQWIQLTSGLTITVVITGCLSLDLSAALTYSLWNKDAESLIRNSGSYTLATELEVLNEHDTIKLNKKQDMHTVIDFTTNVDFSDKTKMCLNMFTSSQPVMKHEIKTYECLDGCKKPRRSSSIHTATYPGQCFPMPHKNYQLCNSMVHSH